MRRRIGGMSVRIEFIGKYGKQSSSRLLVLGLSWLFSIDWAARVPSILI